MTKPVEPAEENALRCAEILNRYWAARGILVNAHVKAMPLPKGGICYPIVSDLVNGWPVEPTDKNPIKEWIK